MLHIPSLEKNDGGGSSTVPGPPPSIVGAGDKRCLAPNLERRETSRLAVTALPTLTTSATAASSATGSPYAISASGAVGPNYTISYVAGSLAITTAPLTISADNQTKVYGAALPPLTASYTGFVNGDTSRQPRHAAELLDDRHAEQPGRHVSPHL